MKLSWNLQQLNIPTLLLPCVSSPYKNIHHQHLQRRVAATRLSWLWRQHPSATPFSKLDCLIRKSSFVSNHLHGAASPCKDILIDYCCLRWCSVCVCTCGCGCVQVSICVNCGLLCSDNIRNFINTFKAFKIHLNVQWMYSQHLQFRCTLV